MAHPSDIRLIPDCRVSVAGKALDFATDGSLVKVQIDLDVDLFGQCVLTFNDPKLALINGDRFQSGTAIKVEVGFASKLARVFEGEVVSLEPQFRRDLPVSLRVVCQESLHRLALSQMTRSFLDVDDKQIVSQIANEHGLSGEGPAGTRQHILQGNVTDATFLRRIAQKEGKHLRIEGKKLIIAPPPKGPELTLLPGDGLRKVKIHIKANSQVEQVTVHGYDPRTKREFSGKARGEGVVGEGTKTSKGKTLSIAGHEPQPADSATAERMAKGRMRKLAEGYVVAQVETTGDAKLLPGATVKLEKMGANIDGSYRVEHALHFFSKHGYLVNFKAVRVAKAKPPRPARAPAAGAPPPSAPPKGAPAKAAAAKPADPKAADAAANGGAPAQAQIPGSTLDLTFEPSTGFCGDTIQIKGVGTRLPDGPVTITFKATQGSSPKLKAITAQIAGGKLAGQWQIANVDFGGGLNQVSLEASAAIAEKFTASALNVKGRSDAPSRHYSQQRSWSGFGVNAHFDQALVSFRNQVAVTFNILKGYGATWVNMSSAGITGKQGVPWDGYRWGRSASPRSMSPDQYWDGAAWQPMPRGFIVSPQLFGTIGFYASGAGYASPTGATYPEAFADYDFGSPAYTQRRSDWVSDTHARWTDAFLLRRKGCPSDSGVVCCNYSVEVALSFNTVSAHASGVVLVCAGALRSNTDTWFMDDDRIAVAAHEAGHYLDNPDEYAGGALDTSVNGDGAVNGIDANSLMGQNLSVVKKRHYAAFATMVRRLVKGAYGLDAEHEVVDK